MGATRDRAYVGRPAGRRFLPVGAPGRPRDTPRSGGPRGVDVEVRRARFPVAHRRAPAALVAPLLAALIAGALPLPAAGGAATSPEPNVRVQVEPQDARIATAPVPPAADATTDAPPEQPSIAYLEAMAHEDDVIDSSRAAPSRSGSARGRRIAGRSMARRRARCLRAARQAARWRPRSRGAAGPTSTRPHPPAIRADPAASPDPAPSDAPGTPDATPGPVDEPSGDEVVAADGASFAQPVEQSVDLAAASGPPSPGLRLPALLGAVRRVGQAQLRRPLDHRLLLVGASAKATSARRTPTARTPPAGAAGRARR